MRLVVVTPAYGRQESQGGVAVSAERIVGHLVRAFDTCVVTPSMGEVPGHDLVTSDDANQRLSICRYGRFNDRAEDLQYLGDLLERIARIERPDAIISFYVNELAFPASLVASRHGIKHFGLVRGNDIDLAPYGVNGFHVKHALEYATGIGCVSHEAEQKVKSIAPNTPTVWIPNGIDVGCYETKQTKRQMPEHQVIGIFGEIKRKKGLNVLLAAMDFDAWKLKIIGDFLEGTDRLLHGYECLRSHVAACVEHVPYIRNHAELISHYLSCDVVCIPSHHEGMPNVLLEAMTLGRVVVASRVGGAVDVIEDGVNGFLFEPRNATDLRSALHKAVSAARDPEQRIGSNARITIASEFTSDREAKRYHQWLGAKERSPF